MTEQEKRDELRARIKASEHRNAERSAADYIREARDCATAFVKEHPFATVAGGVAIGVVIAALVPGPGRRMRKEATKRTSAFAAMLSELGIAYGTSLLEGLGDAAITGRDKLEDIGDSIGDSARDLRREAGYRGTVASDGARRLTRELGKKAGRKVRDVRARMAH